MADPDPIAATYLHLHHQHRSTWAFEVVLRPWARNGNQRPTTARLEGGNIRKSGDNNCIFARRLRFRWQHSK